MKKESISNRKTPKYYGEFRSKVIQGIIPVCDEISLEMNRIDARIANPEYFYDPTPVEGFISFCESELTKTDGTRFKMLDSFKLWAEQLFGWYYYTTKLRYDSNGNFKTVVYKKRLISKLYLIVARGSAKSMFAAFVQAYILVIDPETTHQITTAPTMKQADEVLAPLRTAIMRSPGPLFKFLTKPIPYGMLGVTSRSMLLSTKKGIQCEITGSLLEIRPMTIDRLQGLRPKVTTADEWLSGDVKEDVVGAIEQGASKLEDYIIVAISSEGVVRNGSGDNIKLELSDILTGKYHDPHSCIFHYKLDKIEEVGDPKMWVKANPNLGLTVSYETYEREVARSIKAPSTRNDTLAKRFGIPMNGFTYFFTYEDTIPHAYKSYNGMACSLGLDLSQGDDFCSFTFWFPTRYTHYGMTSINFISERTLKKLPPASRIKYDEFIAEGSLIVLDGSVLDMEEVFEVLDDEIQKRNYEIICLGYDPYNADAFLNSWKRHYGDFGIEKVIQGSRTESVPLGELKIFAEERLLRFHESIVSYAMGNCMVAVDTNGNRKLYKQRYSAKIDPVSSCLCAYVAYQRNLDLF